MKIVGQHLEKSERKAGLTASTQDRRELGQDKIQGDIFHWYPPKSLSVGNLG